MYLLAKFGGYSCYGNGDINSDIENAKLTASDYHVERFSKSGISTYNSEVPDTAGRKNKKKEEEPRQLQKRYTLHANAIILAL